MRLVDDVVRLGRVERVSRGSIELVHGRREIPEQALFIDCTADGLAAREVKPIFEPGKITLQSVFMCQQVFSAALIARLETATMTDAERNHLVTPVPHPTVVEDMSGAMFASAQNMLRCLRRVPLWLRGDRLFFGHHTSVRQLILGTLRLRRHHRRAIAGGKWSE